MAEKLSFEDIRKSGDELNGVIVIKCYSHERLLVELNKNGITLNDEQKRGFLQSARFGGRTPHHIFRLLTRPYANSAEEHFAYVFLKYGIDLSDSFGFHEHSDLMYYITHVLSTEKADTMMWWTFAPYVLRHLHKTQYIGERESMKRTLLWAATSDMYLKSLEEQYAYFGLLGTRRWNKDPRAFRYSLPDRLESPIHKFTDQEAGRIVQEYLCKDKWLEELSEFYKVDAITM